MKNSVVAKIVYRNLPLILSNRVTLVDLVVIDMFDFDIILGIDWFHSCFCSKIVEQG